MKYSTLIIGIILLMAGHIGAQETDLSKLTKFYFRVEYGSSAMSFQEVSGLDMETDSFEHGSGDASVKVPGIKRAHSVTLKKGISKSGKEFWDWYSRIKTGTVERMTVTITLLDETDSPAMVWTLTNACPVEVTGLDLKSDGQEVAIESMDIEYEEITASDL